MQPEQTTRETGEGGATGRARTIWGSLESRRNQVLNPPPVDLPVDIPLLLPGWEYIRPGTFVLAVRFSKI